MLTGAQRVGVAVSGGADSVCLFLLLRGLPHVSILHLNHVLRAEESDGDEEFVRALAARFDVPIHVRRVDVRSLGGNLEESARHVRYEFFREVIGEGAVDCVATGHTLSDQAETVLFRMLRGAHLAGLAAIHPVAPGPIIRPLLGVSRDEVEQYLRDAGEPWREDSSNSDLDFDRNRIRHTLLPMLEAEWNPQLGRSLGNLATLAFDEEQFWNGWIARHAHEHLEFRGNIALACASKLSEQPVAVARRLVRRAMEHVRGDLHAIEFAHVEAALDLARSNEGDGRFQAPRVDVYRSFDQIRFGPVETGDRLAARNQETACLVPGRTSLSLAGVVVDLEVIENKESCTPRGEPIESGRVREYDLDWDRVLAIGSELRLRTWKPGDQYAPKGQAGKVKTMFQQGRIPLWERGTWPIITVAARIVWTREFGPAAEVAARRETRRILRVRDWCSGESPENSNESSS